MYCNSFQPENMKRKKVAEKPMAFRDAILLAGNTPHLTHKQIDELRKNGKLKNMKT